VSFLEQHEPQNGVLYVLICAIEVFSLVIQYV